MSSRTIALSSASIIGRMEDWVTTAIGCLSLIPDDDFNGCFELAMEIARVRHSIVYSRTVVTFTT